MFSKRVGKYVVAGMVILCLGLSAGLSDASDADNDGIDDTEERALAEKYAPILYFEEKEKVYPVSVDYAISNSNLNRSDEGVPALIDENPTVEELSHYNTDENYYLDNRKGTIHDDGIIEDYRSNMENLGYTVYAHVFKQGNETVIQYWMFYAFNKGMLNTHEGDWEMIQIILNTEQKAANAMYSQHISGQKAKWSQVEKSGDHAKVYVARESHANYFRYYQGKLGLASDYVGKNGRVLKPDDYDLIILGEAGEGNHIAEQGWIDFAGRWGDFGSNESGVRGERGPRGPAYREDGNMWAGTTWGDSLFPLNKNVLAADWIFYNFNMIYIAVLAVSLAFISFGIYRRRKGLEKPFFYILKVDGMNAKSIGNILAIVGIVLAVTSLFYPWYGVSVDAQVGSYQTPGLTEIISIDGLKGVQINLLDENSGMVQVGAIPIAFSLLIGAAILLFILGTIGIDGKKAGRKYMVRGIKFIIPVILILITVMSFSLLSFQLNESGIPGGAKDDAAKIIDTISSHPLGGDKTLLLPEYGSVYVTWGMEIGAFLFIASGIALVISGAMQVMAGDNQMKKAEEE